MVTVTTIAALFATELLLGLMVMLPVLVAPQVFKVLDTASAGRFLRQFFPSYYTYCGSLAAASALALLPLAWEAAVVMGTVTMGFVFARQALMPRINAYRDIELAGDRSAKKPFARLHGLSVILNIGQMLLTAAVLAGFGFGAW
ncbi:DUF4149 domain-containing protein [Elioraea rosea]|uniref:DUF4149 domain-containing protein n=1 Tax=Elioraea rosea TaxID=2492390 RepID=UPI001183EA41|nr:DUF4149 domain-containing protein [Elioraea rosea]